MAYIVIIGVWLGEVLQRAQFFDPVCCAAPPSRKQVVFNSCSFSSSQVTMTEDLRPF